MGGRRDGERCIVRLNHLQSQHTKVDCRVGRAVWSSVGVRSHSHCVALYKDSELTSLCAPSAFSLTLLKLHKHTDALQCMKRHALTQTLETSSKQIHTQTRRLWVSGCNSESLSSIDISPHSCLRWACPAAHEREEKKNGEKKIGGRGEKRGGGERRKSWLQLPSSK